MLRPKTSTMLVLSLPLLALPELLWTLIGIVAHSACAVLRLVLVDDMPKVEHGDLTQPGTL